MSRIVAILFHVCLFWSVVCQEERGEVTSLWCWSTETGGVDTHNVRGRPGEEAQGEGEEERYAHVITPIVE